jgi:hypothetical protein
MHLPKNEIKKLAVLGGADEEDIDDDMTKEEMIAYTKKELIKVLALSAVTLGPLKYLL